MPPSSQKTCCKCPACLSVCQGGIWRARAAMAGHLRRIQHEAQLPQSNFSEPVVPATSETLDPIPAMARQLCMCTTCLAANPSGVWHPAVAMTAHLANVHLEDQLRSPIPPEPPQAASSSTPNTIPVPTQSHIRLPTELMPDTIIPPATYEEDGDEDEDEDISIESLSSRLFTLAIDDEGPDINSHSRLWTSRADFQAAREPSHALPKLKESPVGPLITGAQRLISPSTAQASFVPQNAFPPPGSSSANPISLTVPPHNRQHARHLQVLANIESRILQLGGELSQAQGPEIAQIESQLLMLHSQLEKVSLKSVAHIKERLLNSMRPMFIICAAHTAGGPDVTGPVLINSGET